MFLSDLALQVGDFELERVAFGQVAQLVRALLLHRRGRRFESCPAHWLPIEPAPFGNCRDRRVFLLTIPVIILKLGDDRLRRARLIPDCMPRGTDLVNSVQTLSANRTNSYAALPLAA